MPIHWKLREHSTLAAFVVKWALIAGATGAVIGSAVAFFLWILTLATETRFAHPWLLFFLPFAGVGISAMYSFFGRESEAGNNLIIEQIHEPGGGVPGKMAPLILVGTVVTHLFGGSAGREGTAVQMGGSIASSISRWGRFSKANTKILLMCGIAAGFGAVFGTPLTGAIFALEVLAVGTMSYEALIPCLIASVIGDAVTKIWGIQHTHYSIANFTHATLVHASFDLSWLLLGKVIIAALFFGLASVLFAELTHAMQRMCKRYITAEFLRPVLGGACIIVLTYLLGTSDYLGLGVVAAPTNSDGVSIVASFHEGGASYVSWFWKIIFTSVTLSTGFKGGEVTPLFFIGATLGNALARVLGAPIDLFAALGFVAVFAGATNTPLACTIMGIELFAGGDSQILSSGFVVYTAFACFVSYLMSGRSSIYHAQRTKVPKI